MQSLLTSRAAKALTPLILTLLVVFQAGLAVHSASHAVDHTDHYSGCFVCGVAGHLAAVGQTAPEPEPARVAHHRPEAPPPPDTLRFHCPGLIRGPPIVVV